MISVDVEINVKQQEMKELVAVYQYKRNTFKT